MARQPRTINPTTRTGPSGFGHALKNLDRVANVARKSGRIAQAAVQIALAREYRLQLPAQGSLLKEGRFFETGFRPKETANDGSGSGLGIASRRSERANRIIAGTETGRHRATAIVDAGARLQRQVLDLSRAVNALSRTDRSTGSAIAGRAIPVGDKYATPRLPVNTDPIDRARESLEGRPLSFGPADLPANVRFAPSIRSVIPPTNLSRREFARPSSDSRIVKDGSGRAGITINSSPTVVINAPASGALQQDVIGALRAHREELFDQLKRESARRERAEF
jgi:hypothetical protein